MYFMSLTCECVLFCFYLTILVDLKGKGICTTDEEFTIGKSQDGVHVTHLSSNLLGRNAWGKVIRLDVIYLYTVDSTNDDISYGVSTYGTYEVMT